MKRKDVYALWCAVMLASVPALAVIPSPLPSLDFQLTPTVPSSSETFSIRVSGTWPDSCTPESMNVSVSGKSTMWIDLLLPGYFDPNCSSEDCGSQSSAWELVSSSIGPFPDGTYDVYVRAVDCNETGSYEPASFQVRIGSGSGSGGGGQQPGGSFAQGQRVVLLNDDAVSGLRAGQAGTVICCDSADCSGRILVSWDFWTNAKDDTSGCVSASPLAFPAGSATWVDPSMMMVGRPFDQCGTIRRGLEGCIYFEADDGMQCTVFGGGDLYVELDMPGGVEFDERVRLRGLLDTAIPDPNTIRICPVRDGDVYHPILLPCAGTGIGCCRGDLFPGDRVTLLVDNPREPGGAGAPNLMTGAMGTVICCDSSYGANWVFVSWDNWTDGVNAKSSCDSVLVPYPKESGWWVSCDQIAAEHDGGTGGGNGYVVRIGSSPIRLDSDPTLPMSQQTVTGCATATVDTNSRVQLSVEVTATSAAGGTWTGTVTPEIVDAGTNLVEICVRGENVDLTAVPAGNDRQLASVSVFGVPAQ